MLRRLQSVRLNIKNLSTKAVPGFPYPRVHEPVLLEYILKFLNPRDNGCYLDATFGEGGYTKSILDSAVQCQVVAIDQDPAAIDKACSLSKLYPDGRLTAKRLQFGDMASLHQQQFDGIVMDIGISSSQLASDRGFSFQTDSKLDMRMSYSPDHSDTALRRQLPASVVVNQFSRAQLASIFKDLGQERFARPIAAEIERRRALAPITHSLQLVDAIMAAVPKAYAHKATIHPATRVFQSLRIYVNDELGQLKAALDAAPHLLAPGGRLVVVSFHSLEDSLVKRHFKSLTSHQSQFRSLTKNVVRPSAEEIETNPRSRSAKMRAIERII